MGAEAHDEAGGPRIARPGRAAHRLLQPNQGPDRPLLLVRPRVWVAVLVVAVAAGLGADLLMALLRAVQHLSFDYSAGSFLAAVQRSSPARRVGVLTLAGLVAGTGWYGLRRWGSGGADVAGAVWTRSGQLPVLPTLGNAVLSIVVVAMGASLGREAAPQQVGGLAATMASARLALTDAERRLLCACGAAAGMGAVYNVPLGAALFATEVLLGEITLAAVVPAVATTTLATVVAWTGLPNQPLYTTGTFHLTPSQLVFALLAGPVFGLAAVGWTRAIRWTTDTRTTGLRLLVVPVAVFAALGGLSIAYPQLLGNGRGVIQDTLERPQNLGLLAALLLLKPLVTIACLRSGASGGLFTPTMALGALAGAAGGRLWNHLWPSSATGSYAALGAAALLAAAMQGPLAATVLMVELAPRASALLVPMLLAGLGATLVARALRCESLYAARVRL